MVLATGQEKETMGTAWDLVSEMVMEMVQEKGWVVAAEAVVKLASLTRNFH